jgi:hypothetical protein
MPCRECPDGHWECGEDRSELCQGNGGFRQRSVTVAEDHDVTRASGNTSGDWIKIGEFTARFAVHYRIGYDAKPVVKITPMS